MPGEFGTDPAEDGAFATTTSAAHDGVVGSNTATAPWPGGDGGGAGVRGTSTVPGGAGVRGLGADAGVWGSSDGGVGLLGRSGSGAAAQLESTSGVALVAFGHTSEGNTIHAVNDSTEPVSRTDGAPSGAAVHGETSVPGRPALSGVHHGTAGPGVLGRGGDAGVCGHHDERSGVVGAAVRGTGVLGIAEGPGPFEGLLSRGEDLGVEDIERATTRLDDGRPANREEVRERSRAVVDRGPAELPSWVGISDRGGMGVEVASPWLGGRVPELVRARGPRGNGVWGHTRAADGHGVLGTVAPGTDGAAAVAGIGALAGRFVGAVDIAGALTVDGGTDVRSMRAGRLEVTHDIDVGGDVRLLGADVAEGFEVRDPDVAPGSVLVLDDDGALRLSNAAYDRRVAGVVSGAGGLRPGVLLDQADAGTKAAVALVGKVCCWVDADAAPIAVGDLLTTSDVPGHAMRADDRDRSFGAVLGKAMQALARGRGLIRVLVALR